MSSEASCSSSAFKRLVRDEKDPGIRRSQANFNQSIYHNQSFHSTTKPNSENHSWEAFTTQPLPDSSLRAAPLPVFSENGRHVVGHATVNGARLTNGPLGTPSQWATDFAVFANHAVATPPTAMTTPAYPPTSNHVPQSILSRQPMISLGYSRPTPSLHLQATPEVQFDQEMDQWMNSHGSNENSDTCAGNDPRFISRDEHAGHDEEGISTFAKSNDIPEVKIQEDNRDNTKISSLSEAAKGLLEAVGHEDGDKWKQSAFLSLMRDFRDGTKDITGNEISITNKH